MLKTKTHRDKKRDTQREKRKVEVEQDKSKPQDASGITFRHVLALPLCDTFRTYTRWEIIGNTVAWAVIISWCIYYFLYK